MMGGLRSWSGSVLLLVSSGCAWCDNPYDDSYAAYGGRRERTDMTRGRIGSVFDPAPEIIHPARVQQSPIPATPGERGSSSSTTDESPPSAAPAAEGAEPERAFPETPDGTIELPELEPGVLPDPNRLPSPSELPPDLPDTEDRSAWRNPLLDILVLDHAT